MAETFIRISVRGIFRRSSFSRGAVVRVRPEFRLVGIVAEGLVAEADPVARGLRAAGLARLPGSAVVRGEAGGAGVCAEGLRGPCQEDWS